MLPSPPPRRRYFACALFAALISFIPHTIQAQVWDCSGQYTNRPVGKGDCRPAGGVKSCGSDGNRYFSPRQADEQPLGANCGSSSGRGGISPFVDMRQMELARFGGSGIQERMVAPARAARTSKESVPQAKPQAVGAATVEDIFSCFSNPDKLKLCSPEGLGRFVEQTFMKASRAMN